MSPFRLQKSSIINLKTIYIEQIWRTPSYIYRPQSMLQTYLLASEGWAQVEQKRGKDERKQEILFCVALFAYYCSTENTTGIKVVKKIMFRLVSKLDIHLAYEITHFFYFYFLFLAQLALGQHLPVWSQGKYFRDLIFAITISCSQVSG